MGLVACSQQKFWNVVDKRVAHSIAIHDDITSAYDISWNDFAEAQ